MTPVRVLVAEDEMHVVRVMRLFLERAGYAVEVAGNGREALASIMLNPPDVLLTDINMPHMTGRQLCEAIEEQLPGRAFPIFVMTSMTERENREWVVKHPNATLLEKPISMRRLIAELARTFAAGPGEQALAGA